VLYDELALTGQSYELAIDEAELAPSV